MSERPPIYSPKFPTFVFPEDLPAWLVPPRPPELPARAVKILDPATPKQDETQGLRDYRVSKRAEYLAKIAALGMTEEEYILSRKLAEAVKRRERDRKRRDALATKKRKRELWAPHAEENSR